MFDVSRCLESQLALARAARHLSTEVSNETEAELQVLVNELIDDIAGVKEHFAFDHVKNTLFAGLGNKHSQHQAESNRQDFHDHHGRVSSANSRRHVLRHEFCHYA
jgi:hypothetical protein